MLLIDAGLRASEKSVRYAWQWLEKDGPYGESRPNRHRQDSRQGWGVSREVRRLSFGYVANLLGNHFGAEATPLALSQQCRVFDAEDGKRITDAVRRVRGFEQFHVLAASDGLLLSDIEPLTCETFGSAPKAIHITHGSKITVRFNEYGAHQFYGFFMSLAVPFYLAQHMSKFNGASEQYQIIFAFLNEKPHYPEMLPKLHYSDAVNVDVTKDSFSEAFAEAVMRCLQDAGLATTRDEIRASLSDFWRGSFPR